MTEDKEEDVSSNWMTLRKREDSVVLTQWRPHFGRCYGMKERMNEWLGVQVIKHHTVYFPISGPVISLSTWFSHPRSVTFS